MKESIDFITPKNWEEINQEQVVYLARLMQTEKTSFQIAVAMFVFTQGMKILHTDQEDSIIELEKKQYKISNETLRLGGEAMMWITENFEYFTPHFEKYRPISNTFEGVTLSKFIACENWYQAFLATRKPEHLQALAKEMFERYSSRCEDLQYVSFIWFTGIKQLLAKTYSNYFLKRSTKQEEESAELDMRDYIFSTVRALTGGDITKTDKVMETDTWTAMYELDQKAKEIFELKNNRK